MAGDPRRGIRLGHADAAGSEIIARLGLIAHPEGGWYRETWREPAADGARAASTAILYLLRAGDLSRWHRVDATEVFHHYAGAPLELRIAPPTDGRATDASFEPVSHRLGADVLAGQEPQVVVPAGSWQSARSLGEWTLVGCTVAPGFEFDGFELAPRDWEPGAGRASA